ncbi:hypothetical protein [Dictyobacter arantiisoli]|uniref:Uncharacterized protein n=1 Tax=Dictyobacter arantiisoli TaxID=2014874 RepID=A0A5A5T7V7_9CHLR|nr:hypothetical protein [Dictyobacter arantiisoli]GCF07335.1 hypothetical protein KDI_08990 [Dictyobacter arantiisoli]
MSEQNYTPEQEKALENKLLNEAIEQLQSVATQTRIQNAVASSMKKTIWQRIVYVFKR